MLVRWAGVRAPPKTSVITRSAQASGTLPSPSRASPPRTLMRHVRSQGSSRRTSSTSAVSSSTTCCVERGRVAAV